MFSCYIHVPSLDIQEIPQQEVLVEIEINEEEMEDNLVGHPYKINLVDEIDNLLFNKLMFNILSSKLKLADMEKSILIKLGKMRG